MLRHKRVLPLLHLRDGRRTFPRYVVRLRALRIDFRRPRPIWPAPLGRRRHREVLHGLSHRQPRHRHGLHGIAYGHAPYREPHGIIIREPPTQPRPHPFLRPPRHRGPGRSARYELHHGARLHHHRRSLQHRKTHGHHDELQRGENSQHRERRIMEPHLRPHLGALLSGEVRRGEPPQAQEDGDACRDGKAPRIVICFSPSRSGHSKP